MLHVINGEFYAGAERVQDLLAQQLGRLGVDIAFACLKDGLFDSTRVSRDTPLYALPMRSRTDFRQCLNMARLIRRENFAIVHTHTPRAALIGQAAATLAGVPFVHHVHSPAESDTEQGWRNLRNSLSERFSLLRVRRLLPVSGSLERYLLDKGYPQRRIHKVCNGVPVDDLRRARHSAGAPFVVGTVALFRPRKGIEVLLEALAELRDDGLDVRLHAVGPFETGAYEADVLARTRALGLVDRVTWTGFTSDVPAEFPQMHAFALPSLFGEGMPMVVLEAMAAGLPVVSTRVEGIPEVVRHGREGLLAEPGDPAALAAAIRDLATGAVSAADLGDAGRERQRAEFSDRAMAREVAAVYAEVLEER